MQSDENMEGDVGGILNLNYKESNPGEQTPF